MRIDSLSVQTILEWAKTLTNEPLTLYIYPQRVYIVFSVRETNSQKEVYSLAVLKNELEGRKFKDASKRQTNYRGDSANVHNRRNQQRPRRTGSIA